MTDTPPIDCGERESRIGSQFLRHIKIGNFGSFSNKVVGPFSPHLNVVFGKNEAGKTTLSAFVGGVLFGWEDARGGRNVYKPLDAERSGSLFFSDCETQEEVELSRVKNTDGLKGDASVIEDIDKETFTTMFSLNSDELRSLSKTTDVTAKLLTAGAGTNSSPTYALGEIQRRINEFSSKAAGIEHSLIRLEERRRELRALKDVARQEAEHFKQQDKEFHGLIPERDTVMEKLLQMNEEIETLTAGKAGLERLLQQLNRNEDQIKALQEDEKALEREDIKRTKYGDENYAGIDKERIPLIKDRIDALTEEQSRYEHSILLAKEDHTSSQATYEALIETDDRQTLESKAQRQRRIRVTLSIILPILFIGVGIPIFMHGRDTGSLSFTALGIGLVFFAVVLAFGTLALLLRPDKAEEDLKQRKNDAYWVVLQDKKKVEVTQAALAEQEKKVSEFLEKEGLGAAQGSLRRARLILDEIKENQAEENLQSQKRHALHTQRVAFEEARTELQKEQEGIYRRLGKEQDASLAALDSLILRKTNQRNALIETSETLNRRYGELKQELAQARHMKQFDALKLEYQQVRTRQKEASQDLARLLLAKRILETAINAWEGKSQPEVYRQASSLLSSMTAGRWVRVLTDEKGQLQVVDAVKTTREPVQLSLGTCQQLYLSLRIALLMKAENVGRMIPVLADDILVNFDAERRRGAVKALLELSRRRQVIIFTCHEDVLELIRDADPKTNIVEL